MKGHRCDNCEKFITNVTTELCSACSREYRAMTEKANKLHKRPIPVDNPQVGTRYYDNTWVWEFDGNTWTNIKRLG